MENKKLSKTENTRSAVAGSSEVEPAENENSNNVKNDWHPGDMAWARLGRQPYWPCMVVVDPNNEKYFETKKTGRTSQCLVHVQFYGDNGSHSWVSANHMIQYKGKDNFFKFAESKKKDKKYASAFLHPGKNPKWDHSVQEAEEGASKHRNERLYFFDEYYPIYINKNKETVKKTKKKTVAVNKREKFNTQKSSTSGNSTHNTQEEDHNAETLSVIQEKTSETSPVKDPTKQEDDKPVAETSRVIPENDSLNKDSLKQAKNLKRRNDPGANKNSKSENSSSKRVRKYKRKKKLVGKFEVFVDRCAHLFALDDPTLQGDEAKCRRFMAAMWTSMTEEEKSRYHGSYEEMYAALEG